MALLRQVPNRNRKLTIPITEALEQRLESVRSRCQERHMELPFQEAFEAFLGKLIDDAEAELSGAAPTGRKRGGQPPRTRTLASAGVPPSTPPAGSNGQATTA